MGKKTTVPQLVQDFFHQQYVRGVSRSKSHSFFEVLSVPSIFLRAEKSFFSFRGRVMFTFQNGKKSARKETKTPLNLHLFSDSRSTPSNQFFRSMDNILQWLGWVQKHWWIWNHLSYQLFCQTEFNDFPLFTRPCFPQQLPFLKPQG